MKRVITAGLGAGEEMDAAARRKIDSLSKHVAEGSPEWEVLYRKYLREEEGKGGS